MKILVCISNVPDTTAKINFTSDNKEFVSAGVTYIINPYDEIALARALELTEGTGGTVTVINVGDATTEPTIRKALAIGAADAVRINAVPRDAYFVSKQIAEYVKQNPFDMILCGRESSDYNGTSVPMMVAEMLGIPSVSSTKKLTVDGSSATIEREIEGGKEIISVPMPFVAGASEGMSEPKIPNMRGIMSARTKPLKVVEAVPVPELAKVVSFDKPVQRSSVKLISPDDAGKLWEMLRDEKKVI
ncbi:MAG: electron transfer flavoprotein subunit beta/FixA family protein [Bacteroidetes bacterium]|nr:electron transfer flavoprotein subunit beta/FixA family protein [Bacteroidota bacterium]